MSRGTLDPAVPSQFSPTGLSPSLAGFPKTIPLTLTDHFRGPNPGALGAPVWALSISLAATLEIDFSFSSSGYLDVSVHRVPFHTLWIGVWMTGLYSGRVSPFRHPRIKGYLLLPAAFRSLSRLSSALSAKASTLRSF